ncbi:exostosin 2 [Xylogone sp. PMI_703]|nr:exostosin 2 [Xylogone sp. PMI_703]
MISTYKRPKELESTLQVLLEEEISSLFEIVVIWNNVEEAAPGDYVSKDRVLVKYRVSPRNSLNEKLRLDPDMPYHTRGILLSDDDVYYKPLDLEFVFQTWRKFGRRRLTGALSRCSTLDTKTGGYNYDFCEKQKQYSMILTNLAFIDIAFMDYYSGDMDPRMTTLRTYVDNAFNCEDIVMNFVTPALTCEGPLLVKGKDHYVNYEPSGGISRRLGHLEDWSKCVNDFIQIFDGMPLIN